MRQRLASFGRSRRAATSVELAIIGPFFILLVLMIIENGMMLFAQSVLDNATVQAARQIQIGAVSNSTSFRSALCAYTSTLFTCSNFQFYVVSSTLSFPSAVMPQRNATFALSSFSTGSGGDFVVAEVAYNRSYVSPWLVTLGTSWPLLSISAFQNEPFS